MRIAVLVAAGSLAFAGCAGGGATAPAASRSGPLVATRAPTPAVERPPTLGTFTYFAELKTSDVIPQPADEEASCTGQGRLVLRAKLDPAGAITAASAQILFFVTGCPPATEITLADVRTGSPGRTGAASISTGPARPTAVQQGGIGINVDDITVDAALVPQIVGDPAAYYFEVRSTAHPMGLLRGQLRYEP